MPEPEPKKRNPTDSTMRNVRAAKKRIAALEAAVVELATAQKSFVTGIIAELVTRVYRLERRKK